MNSAELTKRKLQSMLAGLGLVALLVVASVAHGAGGPFLGLSGAWTGPGTVTLAGGTRENIRCRATYNVDGSGANLRLDLRCSSDSFKFELQSTVSHNNGEVSGFWNEATNRIGGTVSGKAAGNKIEVVVAGPLSAKIALSTNADRQSVSIQSPGSKVSEVAISLSRGIKQAALQ